MIPEDRIVRVADNAIPKDLAEKLYSEIQKKEWSKQVQTEVEHYNGAHNFGGDERLPDPDETYTASFSYSVTGDLEEGITVSHILPIVFKNVGRSFGRVRLNAYKLEAGDHMRAHFDTYIGPCAFVLYLCRNWKADWGGIWVSPDFGSVLPAFNRLLMVYGRVPHLVSRIEEHARCPRYSLNGFSL